jgi:DNA-binding response OmpR family regulator
MIAATGTAEAFKERATPNLTERSPTAGHENSMLLVGLERLAPPLIAGFEAEGVRTLATDSDEEALLVSQRHRPRLILVGQESLADPLAVVHDIRAVHPGACILFLASSTDPEPALEAMAQGADDIVPPPHSVSSVLLRARILQRREQGVGGGRQGSRQPASNRLVIDRLSRTVLDGKGPVALTGREFELLERLLEANGQVVPRGQILADIWGQDQDNEAVLDATVHRLRRKLEDDPGQPTILTTVRGVGYRLAVQHIRLTGS